MVSGDSFFSTLFWGRGIKLRDKPWMMLGGWVGKDIKIGEGGQVEDSSRER